ncbi:MAG: 30S ribosomal protein S1, partial [Bacteroidales bacterium]|nr:30S ribosomal protein S1 [Bacteroidales bacterium]
QLLPNPWDQLEAKYPVGSVVEGTVTAIAEKGSTVTLEDGTEALAFNRELLKEDGKQAIAGEKLSFKVIELRRSTHTIRVSHVRTYQEAKEAKAATEAESAKKAVKKINSSVEKTTLGDISELAALKDKLSKGE